MSDSLYIAEIVHRQVEMYAPPEGWTAVKVGRSLDPEQRMDVLRSEEGHLYVLLNVFEGRGSWEKTILDVLKASPYAHRLEGQERFYVTNALLECLTSSSSPSAAVKRAQRLASPRTEIME